MHLHIMLKKYYVLYAFTYKYLYEYDNQQD
jgi:hypothetical protein